MTVADGGLFEPGYAAGVDVPLLCSGVRLAISFVNGCCAGR